MYEDDTVQALNDGYAPKTSGAKDRDKHTWWPRKGSGSTPWGSWTLYRMDRDPSELNDLSEKYPQRVVRMKERWYDLAEETNVIPGPE